MAEAKSKSMWEIASHVMATVCNCAFGSRGGFKPSDFNPYDIAEAEKPRRVSIKDFADILKSSASR